VGEVWIRMEVEAVVADYFSMFSKELRLEPYKKVAHLHALSKLLINRSKGSIEFKHQNISSVLIDLGFPYITGYKPRSNYQQLLFEVVQEQLIVNRELENVVRKAVDAPAAKSQVLDVLQCLVAAPELQLPIPTLRIAEAVKNRYGRSINYLEREARNSSLGLAGEEFVLLFERTRLENLGLMNLAERVEHTSVEEGDGAGFDIRSFEPNGTDRLIEVKTTAYGKQTPFFVTRNELSASRQHQTQYHLLRVFEFRKDPKLFELSGQLDKVCRLEPNTYVASIG
jgi:hypothetical protein